MAKDAELWSVEDLEALQQTAMLTLQESRTCHDSKAPRAALILLATSFEAALLSAVIAFEDHLRAAKKWPEAPSYLHLPELADLAYEMGWLSAPVRSEVKDILHKARIMAAHPGAYVQIVRNASDIDLDDPIGYEALLEAVRTYAAELPSTPKPKP